MLQRHAVDLLRKLSSISSITVLEMLVLVARPRQVAVPEQRHEVCEQNLQLGWNEFEVHHLRGDPNDPVDGDGLDVVLTEMPF